MQYSVPITVQPTNTQSNPATVDATLNAGLLRRVDIIFPPGPAGLVHVYITRGGSQVLPTTANQTFFGDNIHFSIPCLIQLTDEAKTITIKGYNVGCTFPHTILCIFDVAEPDRIDWLNAI